MLPYCISAFFLALYKKKWLQNKKNGIQYFSLYQDRVLHFRTTHAERPQTDLNLGHSSCKTAVLPTATVNIRSQISELNVKTLL